MCNKIWKQLSGRHTNVHVLLIAKSDNSFVHDRWKEK